MSEFEVGDRVRPRFNEPLGTITRKDKNNSWRDFYPFEDYFYEVVWDDGSYPHGVYLNYQLEKGGQ